MVEGEISDVMVASDRRRGIILLAVDDCGAEMSPEQAMMIAGALTRAARDQGFRPGVDAASTADSYDPPVKFRDCAAGRRRRRQRS